MRTMSTCRPHAFRGPVAKQFISSWAILPLCKLCPHAGTMRLLSTPCTGVNKSPYDLINYARVVTRALRAFQV